MNPLSKIAIAAFVFSFLISATALAVEADRSQPMDIFADHSVTSDNGKETHLTGNFSVVQGSLKITADKALIKSNEQGFSSIVVDGKPATLEQQLDEGGITKADALNIDYNVAAQKILLKGSVNIVQPKATISANEVSYDTVSGQINASGKEGVGRVHMRLLPVNKSAEKPQ